MKKDDTVYLRHILDAIDLIDGYLQGVDESKFMATSLLQDGAIRQLEIIGEAVRHVSKELRKQYPAIPWEDIAGMRDKLIHDYFGVDLEKVWVTVREDLPALRQQTAEVMNSLSRNR